jgi:hypothetical protein
MSAAQGAEAAKQPDRIIAPRAAKRSVGNHHIKETEPAKPATEINPTDILLQLDSEAAKQSDRVLAPRAAKRSVGNRTWKTP